MPRGGRKPGAGAPKHNFNALKNGKNSDRMRRLGAFLLRHPLLRLIYKRIRANLAKQPRGAGCWGAVERGCLAIFVDGKLQRFYLAPKNKKNQSNIVIIMLTKQAVPKKTIIQSPTPKRHVPNLPKPNETQQTLPLPVSGRGWG